MRGGMRPNTSRASRRARTAILLSLVSATAILGFLAGPTPSVSSQPKPTQRTINVAAEPTARPTTTTSSTQAGPLTAASPEAQPGGIGTNAGVASTAHQPATHGPASSVTHGSPPSTTTTTTTTTTTSIAAQKPVGLIGVSDGHLELDGQPYRFVGVNAYEIGTEFGVNPGCGGQETDAQLDQLFSSLAPNSLVRFWAFQDAIATNVRTDQLDWAPLDRVFAAAAAHGQRLIVTLTDQGGVCDGNHWQDPSWFEGGFQDVYNSPSNTDGSGHTPQSYWNYMQDVVNRYKNSPALGVWEPISEAEASTCDGSYYPATCWGHTSCPDEAVAAAALRHFFDVVGAEIHALDPSHLVENGLLGGGQCGTQSGDYEYVSASLGVDVLSYHDYYAGTSMGGDQWNGIGVRIAQAASLGKPVIAGEMGLDAGTAAGCLTLGARSSEIQGKIRTQMGAGTSGALIWDWLPAPSGTCTTDTYPGDPLMAVIAAGPPMS